MATEVGSASTPPEEHRQGAVFGIDRDDIVVAVLIQVGREELGGAQAHIEDVEFVVQLGWRLGQLHGAGRKRRGGKAQEDG